MHRANHTVIGCLLLVVITAGCDRAAKSRTFSSESAEFQSLLDTSMAELRAKTEAQLGWGLGRYDRWDINQDVGDLVFSNADGTGVNARAQIIGSFSTADNTWLWAWDNPSIDSNLKRDALRLKAYGQKHGIEKLTSPKWTCTQDDAWAMVALAVKLCDAKGAYRGPADSLFVFMTSGELKPNR